MSFDRSSYLFDQGWSVHSGSDRHTRTFATAFAHTRTLLFTHTASYMRAVSSLINSHFLYLLSMWHFDPISVAEGTLQVQELENVCKRKKKALIKMHTHQEGGKKRKQCTLM